MGGEPCTPKSAFHPCFNLASGECLLDFKRQENRAIFIALYRHLQLRRVPSLLQNCSGDLQSSAENLTPVWTQAMVLTLDFALRASVTSGWWTFNTANPTRNLDQLPNMAYFVALATTCSWRQEAARRRRISWPGVTPCRGRSSLLPLSAPESPGPVQH